LGITATNSYTVLDISKDLMDYSPDLIIVYDGHNEFYGVLGAASNDRVAPARWMTLLYLRMVHLRTFQLTSNIVGEILSRFGKKPVDYSNRVTMMEQVARGKTIPYGNDIYEKGYTIFQANLKDLAHRCRDQKIPLILSTQVSNFRDQQPFISNHSSNTSERQHSRFQQFYKSGLVFQSEGNLDSACASFRSAIALDSLYADAHYHLAQCLDTQAKKHEAYAEYILARNYDELRFRTDSKFNNLIRSLDDHEHEFVADIEEVFKSLSQDSLVGRNFIFEHLHPNARGHFFIAKEYVRLMREHSLLTTSEEWAKCDTVTDAFLWERRHLTDLDEFLAARKTEFLTSGWPFQSVTSAVTPVEKTDTLRFIAELAARNQIGWDNAHRRAAEFYLLHNDGTHARMEYETIINQFPLDLDTYLKQAQFCFEKKEFLKAETILLATLHVRRTSSAYRVLGDIQMKQGRSERAIQYYEELNKFPADPVATPENNYMLAVAYLLSQKTVLAVHTLEQILNQYPSYRPAQELLARIKSIEKTHPSPR
jgi:tetratricopeptide (TPR) repeat protein